jgi:tRNA-Thr(GGU) m(6)t(6)A37 methyltransferase TsaA
MTNQNDVLPTRWFRAQAIGSVGRPGAEFIDPRGYYDPHVETALQILPRWADALDGIEEYSHLIVVCWLDRAKRTTRARRHRAEGRQDMPEVGGFATRTPQRPNPIGLCTPRLLRRDGLALWVSGIDAWPGTPILDLKGYTPRDDLHPDATVPNWLQRLWALHDNERERPE